MKEGPELSTTQNAFNKDNPKTTSILIIPRQGWDKIT